MVICLEQCVNLHMTQLMPLVLTVSCSSKIQIGSTFLVPAHPGSPRKRAVKWVRVLPSEVTLQSPSKIGQINPWSLVTATKSDSKLS